MKNLSKRAVTIALTLCPALLFCGVNVAKAADAVETTLSSYELVTTQSQLEALAGGQDALVERLLVLRRTATVPAAGVRAEKILLQYADRPEVEAALLDDISSAEFAGLARAATLNVDRAPAAARSKIARAALERAKTDKAFESFARALLESKDESVKSLARTAFGS